MRCNVPEPLKFQHEEIKEGLANAVKEGGKIGKAAKAVAEVVEAHFAKEEELVFPLFGFLQPLAQEKIDEKIDNAQNMVDSMKCSLMVLHDEHKSMLITLKPFIEAAKDEKRHDYLRFAVRLLLHVREEKEFLYPTAILIGNYLKLNMAIKL